MVPPEMAANPARATAARTLMLDAAAVECISALRGEGIRAILLKGPVTVRWLYSDGGLRDYIDIDLLVDPAEFPQASRALEGLGFRDTLADRLLNETPPHAHEFRLDRSSLADSAMRFPVGLWVDLHWSFQGVEASAQEFWRAVTASAERMRISGAEVEVPGEPTRALLLALHAARSGVVVGQPLVDLDRALERLSDDMWRAAHDLAMRLDAVPRFLAGLATRPLGLKLIERLHLEGGIDVASALYAAGIPPVAAGLERLRATAGPGARARLLARELVPTRSFMLAWSSLARRGALGLALAYAYRPLWLLAKLPAAFQAHARARRAVEDGGLPVSRGDKKWESVESRQTTAAGHPDRHTAGGH